MTEEIWKPVVGFEGLYEVSNLGRVRRDGRVLRPGLAGKGYLRVQLSRDGIAYSRYVHQLAAEAFLGPCPDGQEVRHRDGVKVNCAESNLTYGTPVQNNEDKKFHGTHLTGEAHHNHKLTVDEVLAVRASGQNYSELGRRYGVSPATIRDVKLRRTWRHV